MQIYTTISAVTKLVRAETVGHFAALFLTEELKSILNKRFAVGDFEHWRLSAAVVGNHYA